MGNNSSMNLRRPCQGRGSGREYVGKGPVALTICDQRLIRTIDKIEVDLQMESSFHSWYWQVDLRKAASWGFWISSLKMWYSIATCISLFSYAPLNVGPAFGQFVDVIVSIRVHWLSQGDSAMLAGQTSPTETWRM